MLTALLSILILLFATLAIILLKLGITILRADSTEYKLNKMISDSPIQGILKERKDSRAQAGMIINKNNHWVEQGRISDEAIDSVLN